MTPVRHISIQAHSPDVLYLHSQSSGRTKQLPTDIQTQKQTGRLETTNQSNEISLRVDIKIHMDTNIQTVGLETVTLSVTREPASGLTSKLTGSDSAHSGLTKYAMQLYATGGSVPIAMHYCLQAVDSTIGL